MKRVFRTNLTVRLWAVMVLSLFAASCSNDAFFGFDEGYQVSNSPIVTKSENIDFSNYLTVSSLNTEKWDSLDLRAFVEAIERMGVFYSELESRYKHLELSYDDINISDSLYYTVLSMFEHTNNIINDSRKKFARRKSPTGEQGRQIPDCVPAAVSRMETTNAPSYDEAIARCSQRFPFWQTFGGIPIDQVESFINEYVTVTRYVTMSFCPYGDTSLPNYVMRINNGSHAVNAYKCSKINYIGRCIILYDDYSSTSRGKGSIFEEQMFDIFKF